MFYLRWPYIIIINNILQRYIIHCDRTRCQACASGRRKNSRICCGRLFILPVLRTIVKGIETLLFTPVTDPDAAAALIRARMLFTSLQAGKINRAAMTPSLNDYFSDAVLTDFAQSLGPLGKVEDFTQSSFEDRGGMASYLMPDGKWEQCLIFAE